MRLNRTILAWAAPVLILALGAGGCARYQPAPLSPERNAAALEARSLADPALKDYLEQNAAAPPVWPLAGWDFQSLTLAAFYYHPSLDVARAQWGVVKASVKTAGGHPNPVLTTTPGYSMDPPSGLSPWFPLVTLDVPIETAGKRGYRMARADQLSEAARLNIQTVAWQVRGNVRAGLLDYTAARRRSDLLQKQLQLQQQILTLLEQRLQAGAVTRAELIPHRLTLAKTGVDYADAARLAAEARARLAESVGVPARAMDGVDLVFDLAVTSEAARDLTSAEARRQALLGRADVLGSLAEYAASESALRLEIARQYPDLHFSPGYQFDQDQSKWSLGLGLELPVRNRNQGPIAEATARREEAAARFLALQARVIGEIDRALAVRAATLDQLERYRRLAQLAREQSASVEALVQAGAADRLELSSAQLEASLTELVLLDSQAKAQQAVAQLEDAIQRPLAGWPALEHGRGVPAHKETP